MNLNDFLSDYKSELIAMLISSVATTIVYVVVIGRKRVAWFVNELVKMYSAEKSFFSKKRIESGVAYILAQHGMMFWLAKKYDVMSMTDFVMWAVIEFGISGWYVQQIQKEKLSEIPGKDNVEKKEVAEGKEGITP